MSTFNKHVDHEDRFFFLVNVGHCLFLLPEPCPKCEHPRAYFMPLQTRSADEPMTTFYKCGNAQCGHRWRDWGQDGPAASASACFTVQGAFPAASGNCVSWGSWLVWWKADPLRVAARGVRKYSPPPSQQINSLMFRMSRFCPCCVWTGVSVTECILLRSCSSSFMFIGLLMFSISSWFHFGRLSLLRIHPYLLGCSFSCHLVVHSSLIVLMYFCGVD